MTDQEFRELQRKHIKEAEENGELMFLGIPDSWFEDPHWMCRNEHVSRRYLKTVMTLEARKDKKMGYTTSFYGQFKLNKKLDHETHSFLTKLAETRRMERDPFLLPSSGFEKYGFTSWGKCGEFYVDAGGFDRDKSVLDYNRPPPTQPGLWCQWVPTEDGTMIVWDEGEKFYEYEAWLGYIIDKILDPRGYVLNGMVQWQGEDAEDFGQLKVENNRIYVRHGHKRFGDWK